MSIVESDTLHMTFVDD